MRYLSLLPLAAAGLLLCGCGGPQMSSVKGRVTFNGKPVKEAAVTFSPVGPAGQKETGKPATGFTEENGEYALSTFSNYDGALIGSHTVRVVLDDTNPAKCKRMKEMTVEVKAGGNDFTIEMDPK